MCVQACKMLRCRSFHDRLRLGLLRPARTLRKTLGIHAFSQISLSALASELLAVALNTVRDDPRTARSEHACPVAEDRRSTRGYAAEIGAAASVRSIGASTREASTGNEELLSGHRQT